MPLILKTRCETNLYTGEINPLNPQYDSTHIITEITFGKWNYLCNCKIFQFLYYKSY